MGNKLGYALVGLFIIVLGAVWLAISLWLALGDLKTEYTTYRVYMNESVSGLYIDAPVKYRGVQIGKVGDIRLNPVNPEQVQLTLDIESSVPIKTDTIAVLTVQGLTGIAFVDLTGGTQAASLLQAQEGEEYPVILSGPSFFSRLDTFGMELLANLNILANHLGELLDQTAREDIQAILANTKRITHALAQHDIEIERSVVNASRLFERGADVAVQLGPVLAQIDRTARAFEQMAMVLGDAGDSLNRYVRDSGTGVEQFSQQTLPEIGGLVTELRRLADTLQGVGSRLEEDPRVLLYGRDLELPGPGE